MMVRSYCGSASTRNGNISMADAATNSPAAEKVAELVRFLDAEEDAHDEHSPARTVA